MKQINKISRNTRSIIKCLDFKQRSKKKENDFIRNRKLPFEYLMTMCLKSLKTTTAAAARNFFEDLGSDVTISQQSVSNAKFKVKPEAFREIFVEATVKPLMQMNRKKWRGYRIYAIDGMKVALPVDQQLLEHFGGTGRGATSPTAQSSILYDILNDISIDGLIEPLSVDERTLAQKHIEALIKLMPNEKKLIIFDRGYPSFELLKQLEDAGIKYVMRVKTRFNNDIDAQTAEDAYVNLTKGEDTLSTRVIKVKLSSGETEILLTNLSDKTMTTEDFKHLYFYRWKIECHYNILKNKLELENFTSRTIDGIKQDFFIALYQVNALAALKHDAHIIIDKERNNKDNKYFYQVNNNEAIGIFKSHFTQSILGSSAKKMQASLRKMVESSSREVVPVRPDRSNPRNPFPRKSKFHHNQKSTA